MIIQWIMKLMNCLQMKCFNMCVSGMGYVDMHIQLNHGLERFTNLN